VSPSAGLRRRALYPGPVVDGRAADTVGGRWRRRVDRLLVSAGEREEAELERLIGSHPSVTRANVVGVISPKGGVGKTTSAFVVGSLIADRLRLRVAERDQRQPQQRANRAGDEAAALEPAATVDAAAELIDIGEPGAIKGGRRRRARRGRPQSGGLGGTDRGRDADQLVGHIAHASQGIGGAGRRAGPAAWPPGPPHAARRCPRDCSPAAALGAVHVAFEAMRLLIHTDPNELLREGREEASNALDSRPRRAQAKAP
jgi:hypothetical protein